MAAEAACVVSERGQPVVVVGAAAATASKSGAKVLTTDVVGVDEGGEKPYFCNMPGCEKRYRNSNGLAYHLEHGHCEPKAKKRIRRTKADFAAYLDHLDKGETPPSSTSTSSTTSLPDAMASLQAAAGGYSVKPYGAVAGENGDGGSGPAKKKKKKDDGVEREEAEEGKAVNKPFVCPHPGCRRAYKNKNGLVYHLEKGKGGHHNAPIPKS
ncbi:hypothetical protein HK101_006400 [Irineochytrium annulatum]|nr:hypothetical protein HK101_006400 [Irineochytrium annulatum]